MKTAVAVLCRDCAMAVPRPAQCGRQMDERQNALHNYTYMKNCAEYHTNICVCMCVQYEIWVAIVTPLFEATDRPGVPILCSYDGGVRIDNDKVNRMEIGQRYIDTKHET